jgi:predicted XRE-type DNA-binding protein
VVSDGQRGKPGRGKTTKPAGPPATGESLVTLDDPEMFADAEMRAALVARDITVVYRLLRRRGIVQRDIARRTGQPQSEVSDILRGRRVRDVTVLERIADGLVIPRRGCGWRASREVRVAPTVERSPVPRRR